MINKVVAALLAGAAALTLGAASYTAPVRLAAPTPITVLGIGDSITAGYGPGSNGAGYRTRLRAELAHARRTAVYVGSVVDTLGNHHEGHSGWPADRMTPYAAAWVQATAPQVVLLMAGTNDINNGDTPEQAAEDLQLLVMQTRLYLPAGSVLVLAKIPLIPGKEAAVQDFNARVVSIAARFRLPLADMQAAVPPPLLGDTLHPSQAGYDAMAAAWFAVMQQPVATPRPTAT